MVLLGSLRSHSEEFSFCWQLVRATVTEQIWKTRNKRIFQQVNTEFSDLAVKCIRKIGRQLKYWPGKCKVEARKIVGTWAVKTKGIG
eukprot:c13907_g1_i1 orf=188-448(+)